MHYDLVDQFAGSIMNLRHEKHRALLERTDGDLAAGKVVGQDGPGLVVPMVVLLSLPARLSLQTALQFFLLIPETTSLSPPMLIRPS